MDFSCPHTLEAAFALNLLSGLTAEPQSTTVPSLRRSERKRSLSRAASESYDEAFRFVQPHSPPREPRLKRSRQSTSQPETQCSPPVLLEEKATLPTVASVPNKQELRALRVQRTIKNLEQDADTRGPHYQRFIEAIFSILRDSIVPLRPEQIADEMLFLGWSLQDPSVLTEIVSFVLLREVRLHPLNGPFFRMAFGQFSANRRAAVDLKFARISSQSAAKKVAVIHHARAGSQEDLEPCPARQEPRCSVAGSDRVLPTLPQRMDQKDVSSVPIVKEFRHPMIPKVLGLCSLSTPTTQTAGCVSSPQPTMDLVLVKAQPNSPRVPHDLLACI